MLRDDQRNQRRSAGRLVACGVLCLAASLAAYGALRLTLGAAPAAIHILWTTGVNDADRRTAEERYGLSQGEPLEGRTWAYMLTNTSAPNIRALVTDVAVADTAGIDRAGFRATAPSTELRRALPPRPWLSTALWAFSALFFVAGLAGIGAGLLQRVSPGARRRDWGVPRPVLLLLGVLLALEVTSMRHLTLTYDEPEHLKYGQNILVRLDSTRLDDSGMPISALSAVPSATAVHMPPGPVSSWLERPEAGRYMTVFFSLLVALCVFAWARDLYGLNAGLLALTLYVFDPNLLAHAQLMTTDVFVAGTIAFTLYFFWKFLHHGSPALAVTTGLLLGLAQSSKYTAIVLFPMLAAIAVAFHATALASDFRDRRFDALRGRAARFAGVGLTLAALSLLVVNVAFLFKGTFTPLNAYSFESNVFRHVQSSAGVLGALPLPLPYPYLQGLDLVTAHERTGAVFGRIYLLGRLREGQGFDGYYLYACLYKLPIASLLLLIAAATTYVVRRRRFDFLKNEAVMLMPIAFFAIYFNFFYRAQIGIRHFLVVFPLLYVCSGALLAHAVVLTRPRAGALGVAVAGVILSVLSYYPHFLPYFNELVRDRSQAYTILADSNIDWGQAEWYLARYLASHPDAVVEPRVPAAGTVLVHVNALTGVSGDPDRFRWLREHFTPVDQVAHAVLVYRISATDLQRLDGRR